MSHRGCGQLLCHSGRLYPPAPYLRSPNPKQNDGKVLPSLAVASSLHEEEKGKAHSPPQSSSITLSSLGLCWNLCFVRLPASATILPVSGCGNLRRRTNSTALDYFFISTIDIKVKRSIFGYIMDEERDKEMPRDAKIVKLLLKAMGVQEYEPHVIHQFLELWYRYVADVLTDAQIYSEHAGKPGIDCDDVKLSIQTKVNFSFSQPPPREVLLELARNRNKIPLPKSIGGPGVPLPPEEETLVTPNYQLAFQKKQSLPAEETEEEEEKEDEPNKSGADQQQTQIQRVSFPLTRRR